MGDAVVVFLRFATENVAVIAVRALQQFLEEPSLSDARLASDEARTARAAKRALQVVDQLGKGPFPADRASERLRVRPRVSYASRAAVRRSVSSRLPG
jgi:hypothetical protein